MVDADDNLRVTVPAGADRVNKNATNKRVSSKESSRVISFRVAESVRAAFDVKAKSAGITPSELFRDFILNDKTKVIAKEVIHPDYRKLLFLHQKASNNINQLALRANSDHRAGKLTESTYQQILESLDLLNQLLSVNK
ncbi:antitoxin component of RelBE/YafQ-DinJ toxin-antitoxin module [Actimicrobium sp. GrIS 1.19]|uniref:plasmid mobilization protein n=1 Tax=Actimicrobium sp. GrIS 1.19 TaxID=3071708 RepID=UPI002DF85E8A|nr:antitoxin component of RelBE/YafQ-DinJ toxin-antitoxin module [Actimicrobium sp. GrIS 1.19]